MLGSTLILDFLDKTVLFWISEQWGTVGQREHKVTSHFLSMHREPEIQIVCLHLHGCQKHTAGCANLAWALLDPQGQVQKEPYFAK